MKKQYTKKQITEAIAYWKKRLNEGISYNSVINQSTMIQNDIDDNVSTPEELFAWADDNTLVLTDPYGNELYSKCKTNLEKVQQFVEEIYWEHGDIDDRALDYEEHFNELIRIVDAKDKHEAKIWLNSGGLNEARHDGHWLPKYPTHRNPTEKPTIYYLGVDESDDFRGYGSYVMPNGNLTSSASNDDFRYAAVTKVPAQLKTMIDKAVARYGKDKYIFVFKEAYTYGTQTHKSHARPSVIDVWYPNGQYWRYGLSAVDALQENDMLKGKPHNNHLNESGNFNKTEHLSIACASNPDFSGEFFKADVEEEMRDVGIDMSKEGATGWMSYIFGHMFSDTNEWTAALEDSVLLDNVKKVILSLDGNLVVIEKKQ